MAADSNGSRPDFALPKGEQLNSSIFRDFLDVQELSCFGDIECITPCIVWYSVKGDAHAH